MGYLRDEFNTNFNLSFNFNLYFKLFKIIYPGLDIGYFINPLTLKGSDFTMQSHFTISPSLMLFRGYERFIHIIRTHWMTTGFQQGNYPWQLYLGYGLGKWLFYITGDIGLHINPLYINGFNITMGYFPFKAKSKIVIAEKQTKKKNWLFNFNVGVYSGSYFDFLKTIVLKNNGISPWSYDEIIGTIVDYMIGIHRRIFWNVYLGININYMYRFSNFSIMYFKDYNKLAHEIHIIPDFINNFVTFGYGISIKHFSLQLKLQYYYWHYNPDEHINPRVGIDTYGIYLGYLL